MCKKLLKRFQKVHATGTLFTDEKSFNIEEKFSSQNERIYAKHCYVAKYKIPRAQRSHQPPSVMV